MMFSMLVSICLSLTTFHFSAISAQNLSFSKPATGPSSVCEGSDVTLQCVIILTNPDNTTVVQPSVWSRNEMSVQMTNGSFIPNHSTVFNSTTGGFTDLVIIDVREEDNNTVYTCSATGAPITSSVVLNVAEIPPVENLTVVDQCTTIRASWDITEGSCTDLSYDVTLLSSDGTTLQRPNTTSDAVYNFTNVETFNGNFTVSVVPINGNARGASDTESSDVGVSPNDLPTVTNIANVSTCVTSLNISWDPPSITCGDVVYEVSISQPLSETVTNTTAVRFLNVTGLKNSPPDVTITVTATDRVGQRNGNTTVLQLRRSDDPPPVHNLMPPNFETPGNVAGFDPMISWERPMINSCTTLPITGYRIDITVMFMNGSQTSHTSRFINDTLGGSMGIFNVNYSEIFNEPLERKSLYVLTVIPTSVPDPQEDDDDDNNNTGAIIGGVVGAISFIIVLVVFMMLLVFWCKRNRKEEGSRAASPGGEKGGTGVKVHTLDRYGKPIPVEGKELTINQDPSTAPTTTYQGNDYQSEEKDRSPSAYVPEGSNDTLALADEPTAPSVEFIPPGQNGQRDPNTPKLNYADLEQFTHGPASVKKLEVQPAPQYAVVDPKSMQQGTYT